MMGGVTDNWQRLGGLIQRRRKTLLMSQVDLAEAAGLGRSTVQKLENGTARPEDKTLRLLEKALQWREGSIEGILAGAEPAASDPAPTTQHPALPPLKDRLPKLVLHELETGDIYMTETHDLTEEGGTRLIVVAVRDPDRQPRDPEELRRETRAWLRVQHKLRGLLPLPWEPGDPPEDDTSDVQ